MITLEARNAHEALPRAIKMLYQRGIREDSRNGPVLRMPTPVTTVLRNPLERMTFHDWRDSNPFFLAVEPLWMLAGRDDLAPLTKLVKRMADFSDDGGKTSPGAYGKRWRDWFDTSLAYEMPGQGVALDQLDWVVRRLRENPGDRRVVISMWDAGVDPDRADRGGKDVPCNLMILPWVANSELHLTVFNRSNDIIWGLYTANANQFGTLLEYLAHRIGLRPGTLTTVSNNFHAYEATLPAESCASPDLYAEALVGPAELLKDWDAFNNDAHAEKVFQQDLAMLFEYRPEEVQLKARFPYIRRVIAPLLLAHKHWKSVGEAEKVSEILDQMPEGNDLALAADLWFKRRAKKEAA